MQKKKTYVSVGNNNTNSFSTFGDGDDPLASSNHNFYHEFIRENLFQSAEITHTLIREEENGKAVKPYAVRVGGDVGLCNIRGYSRHRLHD